MRQATNKSEQAYRLYIDKLEAKLATERAITRRKLDEARHDLRNNGREYGKYQNFQVDNPRLYEKHHHGKLEHHLHLMDIAKQNIEENKNKLEHLKLALPTEKEFYELTKLHPLDLLEVNDITKLDLICNELVTNLRAVNNSICYKTKSTIQFAGGFRRNLFWSRFTDAPRTIQVYYRKPRTIPVIARKTTSNKAKHKTSGCRPSILAICAYYYLKLVPYHHWARRPVDQYVQSLGSALRGYACCIHELL